MKNEYIELDNYYNLSEEELKNEYKRLTIRIQRRYPDSEDAIRRKNIIRRIFSINK